MTIGRFEFIAGPGVVFWVYHPDRAAVRRRIVALAILAVLLAANPMRSLLLIALAVAYHGRTRDAGTPVTLLAIREGRLFLGNTDTGPAQGVCLSVHRKGMRSEVLLARPNLSSQPALLWWTERDDDARRLAEFIDLALRSGQDPVTWPPGPATPAAAQHPDLRDVAAPSERSGPVK